MRKPASLPTRRSGPPLWAGILLLLLVVVALTVAQTSSYAREAEICAAVFAFAEVLWVMARIVRRR